MRVTCPLCCFIPKQCDQCAQPFVSGGCKHVRHQRPNTVRDYHTHPGCADSLWDRLLREDGINPGIVAVCRDIASGKLGPEEGATIISVMSDE
jgi:hypothetical protein